MLDHATPINEKVPLCGPVIEISRGVPYTSSQPPSRNALAVRARMLSPGARIEQQTSEKNV